jgi:hypothetical protein
MKATPVFTKQTFATMTSAVLMVLFLAYPTTGVRAESASEGEASSLPGTRAYPGGRDEQDLQVQTALPAPSPSLDRRTVELRVLNNYFKKSPPSSESPEKPE